VKTEVTSPTETSGAPFSFKVNDQTWSEDYKNRLIRSVGLHKGDVSIVTFGANDATSSVLRGGDFTLEQRAQRAEQLGDQIRGVHGGHIVAFGGVTREAPVARRSPLVLPDYTTPARAELDLMRSRMELEEARARSRR